MNRRTFLRASASAVLVAVAGAGCAEDLPSDEVLAAPALTGMFGEQRVLLFGERYRQMVPKESDAETLRRAIVNGDERRFHFSWSTRMTISERVTDDFAVGRTVLVDRWMLSRTEARQCALRHALAS